MHVMADPYPIVPFTLPIDAEVTVPGSKSITNRALVCAAMAAGTSRIVGALVADDTAAMVDCLRQLGSTIERSADGTVADITGTEAMLRPGPLTLDARLSGTTSRFVAPLLSLGR